MLFISTLMFIIKQAKNDVLCFGNSHQISAICKIVDCSFLVEATSLFCESLDRLTASHPCAFSYQTIMAFTLTLLQNINYPWLKINFPDQSWSVPWKSTQARSGNNFTHVRTSQLCFSLHVLFSFISPNKFAESFPVLTSIIKSIEVKNRYKLHRNF